MSLTLKIFLLVFLAGCSSSRFGKDRASFESSAVINKWVAISDLNDSYFEVKENNFFEFYRQLFDSVKNTSYPGRYKLINDTMHLDFYDKKGSRIVGSRAYLDKKNNKIYLFSRP